MEELIKNYENLNEFMKVFNEIYINKKVFSIARELTRKETKEQLEEKQKKIHQNIEIVFQKVKCDPKSPICLDV